MPHLKLLGVPRLVTGDDVLDLPQKQVLLLASYLAYKEDWCSRDELLHLFWPDESEKTARHSLSQLLYLAKQESWITGLETERNRVRWLIDTDVKTFRDTLGDGEWKAASEQYEGSLLKGVSLETSLNFEDWLAQEREQLRSAWREAVLNHAETLMERGETRQAAQQLQELLKQDSLAEDVLQAYLRLALTEESQWSQALRAFETFQESLERELGMTPLETTLELAEKLRSGRPSDERIQTEVSGPPPETTPASLPSYPTPFIGRELERAELAGLLEKADTRLVTLLGAGGTGKTRLVTQLAKEQAGQFKDGAVFVALAPLADPALTAATALQALGLSAPPEQSAEQFLKGYLKDKQKLVVFDNIEHLPESVDLIVKLLDACPELFIVTTSREALGLQAEQVYDLTGLSYPDNQAETPEAYDAVRLFVTTARRAYAAFTLDRDNRDAVSKLCKLLDGSPLGLELAAAWVRLLSVNEIVEELEQNLGILSVKHKDLPERHRSLRAVFEHSWQLLSPEEQRALAGLSVFRGGFTRDAAQEVADVSVRTLLNLVNKSLLKRTTTGRFERHVLVKQFAEEKLEPDALESLRARHAEHFIEFAEASVPKLKGPDQITWLGHLSSEHDNLRAALSWTLETEQTQLGLQLGGRLWPFWYIRSHYQEGKAWLQRLLALSGDEQTKWRARALIGAAVFYELSGDYGRAETLYEQSLAIYRQREDGSGVVDALNGLVSLAIRTSDYHKARDLCEEGLRIARRLAHRGHTASRLIDLGLIYNKFGRFEEAREHLEEGLALAKEIGDLRMTAVNLNNLGDAVVHTSTAQALEHYQSALTIHEQLEDQDGLAIGNAKLGLVAFLEGRSARARQYYEKALETARPLGDPFRVAELARGLTKVLLDLGEVEHATALYAESLRETQCLGDKLGLAQSLEGFVHITALQGRAERALLLAGAAAQLRESLTLPPLPYEKLRLEHQLAKARAALPEKVAEDSFKRGTELGLEAVVTYALEPMQKVRE